MSKSSQSVKRQLARVFAEYRSIIESHMDLLEQQPVLATRIAFRTETAQFYIDQLYFWNERGDMQRFEEAADQARKSLEDLYQLISKLINEYDVDEE